VLKILHGVIAVTSLLFSPLALIWALLGRFLVPAVLFMAFSPTRHEFITALLDDPFSPTAFSAHLSGWKVFGVFNPLLSLIVIMIAWGCIIFPIERHLWTKNILSTFVFMFLFFAFSGYVYLHCTLTLLTRGYVLFMVSSLGTPRVDIQCR